MGMHNEQEPDREIRRIRHENFLRLLKEFRDKELKESPDQPRRGLLARFARYLEDNLDDGLTSKYISHLHVNRKPIGHNVARKLETAFGKPANWMDSPHGADVPKDTSEERLMALVLDLYRKHPDVVKEAIITIAAEDLKEREGAEK